MAMRLDRYARRSSNFVLVVSDRIAVLAARSAAEDTGNQPRGSAGISRGGAPLAGYRVCALFTTAAAFRIAAS